MRIILKIILLSWVLTSCNNPAKERELNPADRVEVPEHVQDKARQIESLYETREISLAEYKFRMAELTDEAGRLQLRMDNLAAASYLPEWALEMGLSVPENMEVVPEFSHMTSWDDLSGMFNAVTLVFTGEYETAMQEAERIAKEAEIPLSTSWQKNFEMSKKLGNPVPKGITYMNYDFGMSQDVDYLVVVEVDPLGKLTISAADANQMKSVIDKHTVDPKK